jgi:hypothetical protein
VAARRDLPQADSGFRSVVSLGYLDADALCRVVDMARRADRRPTGASVRLDAAGAAGLPPARPPEWARQAVDAANGDGRHGSITAICGPEFRPRRTVDATRVGRWGRLARDNAIARRAGREPVVYLGGAVDDPVGALAILAAAGPCAPGSRLRITWAPAPPPDPVAATVDASPAILHELLAAAAALAVPVTVCRPEVVAPDPLRTASAERRLAASGAGLRVVHAPPAADPEPGTTDIALPWGCVRHYDDRDAATAAISRVSREWQRPALCADDARRANAAIALIAFAAGDLRAAG